MMDNQSEDEYYTKDIGEAAALLCKSAKLLRIQKEQSFSWFVFSSKVLCQKLSHEYWFGELSINAKSFSEEFRTLKDRLYAQQD